jgi:hypothetical protein
MVFFQTLAIDATSLGDLFVILAVSVVYRGGAVPIAWKILKAGEQHAWKPDWQALLEQFRGLLPAGWTVMVLADRGLYAKWLFEAIAGLGWHPFLRVNGQGRFSPEGWFHWQPLSSFAPSIGDRWQGRGTVFNGRQSPLGCTLLAHWGEGHQDPWLVLTDLPPGYADACWYGLRAWIEQGFKRCKRGGWQWQHTRMGNPARAERLWMAIAIATGWLLSVGGEAEAQADTPLDIPTVPGTARRRGKRWRIVGVFQHGWSLIVAALLSHRQLPIKPGRPEGWPGLPEINGSTLAISMAGA